MILRVRHESGCSRHSGAPASIPRLFREFAPRVLPFMSHTEMMKDETAMEKNPVGATPWLRPRGGDGA